MYIDQLRAQRTLCLGVKKVPNHKASTIYNTAAEILEKYDQQIDDVGVITTDNVAANLKAFR